MGTFHGVGVNGINAGVQEIERGKEGMAILISDLWYSVVIDFGCVSSTAPWVKFKFSGLKYVWWWGIAPLMGMLKKGRGSGITFTWLWME